MFDIVDFLMYIFGIGLIFNGLMLEMLKFLVKEVGLNLSKIGMLVMFVMIYVSNVVFFGKFLLDVLMVLYICRLFVFVFIILIVYVLLSLKI